MRPSGSRSRTTTSRPACRIAVALRDFWHTRGHLADGTQIAAASWSTPRPADRPTPCACAAADDRVARSRRGTATTRRATALRRGGLAIAEASGDPRLLANAHQGMGWATSHGATRNSRGPSSRRRFAWRGRSTTSTSSAARCRGYEHRAHAAGRMGRRAAGRRRVDPRRRRAWATATSMSSTSSTRGFIRSANWATGDGGARRLSARPLREAQQAGSAVGHRARARGDRDRRCSTAGSRARGDTRGGRGSDPRGGRRRPVDRSSPASRIRSARPGERFADEAFAAAVAAGRAMSTDELVALGLERS